MHYGFGTFAVRTAFPLQALPLSTAAPSGVIDLERISRSSSEEATWVHHWKANDEPVLSLARQDGGYLLRAPGIADFLIQLQPSRLLVSPAPSADASTLEHLVVDQVLPRLLAQHGELMAHASALSMSGRHALFTGPSGWGKSTLAGLLQRQGHAVLSDDCVQLLPRSGAFHAVPTYPSLRLHADSLRHLFQDDTVTTPMAAYSPKQRVLMRAPSGIVSVPVDALYLLGDPATAGDDIRITPLPPIETCQALLRHSFRLDLGDQAANAHQFGLCAAVTRAIPAFRLDYPRDFTRSEELVERITGHLTGLPDRG